jgi:glycosyltransferase involved in cell wall biosynthesis
LVTLDWHGHGGIERCVQALALGLRRLGAEVHVFAASFEGEAPKGLQFHKVAVLPRPWSLKVLSFALAAPRAVAKAGPFDTVHAHVAYAGDCDLATAHSVHRVAERMAPGPRGLAGLRQVLLGLRPVVLWASDQGYRRAKLRLAISECIRKELKDSYGDLPTQVLYYGVDGASFKPASPAEKIRLRRRLGLDGKAFWFCFSGWNWRRKGLDTVLAALPLGARLLVLGEDSHEGSRFRHEASTLEAQGRVRFAGRQDQPMDWVRACDALAFPTRYEPFGMVVSEAMACGLAVLCPASAGASELIRRGRAQQVLKDAEGGLELAKKMRALMRPGLAASLGRSNRRQILAWTWKRHAEATWDAYHSLKP